MNKDWQYFDKVKPSESGWYEWKHGTDFGYDWFDTTTNRFHIPNKYYTGIVTLWR